MMDRKVSPLKMITADDAAARTQLLLLGLAPMMNGAREQAILMPDGISSPAFALETDSGEFVFAGYLNDNLYFYKHRYFLYSTPKITKQILFQILCDIQRCITHAEFLALTYREAFLMPGMWWNIRKRLIQFIFDKYPMVKLETVWPDMVVFYNPN